MRKESQSSRENNSSTDLAPILKDSPHSRKEILSSRANAIWNVVKKRQNNLTLVLDNIHDPHNIAAILRTCDAIGIFEVFVILNEYPKIIKGGNRSSASANKWVKVHLFTEPLECIKALSEKGYHLISTHLDSEAKSLFDINFNQKIAVVMGSEQKGVSNVLLNHSKENLIIPQTGMLESLNVSVATSIILYEALRQRTATGFLEDSFLTLEEQKELFAYYSWV
jgi:tRNA (guanosine-2'-O-)-methyltransferase